VLSLRKSAAQLQALDQIRDWTRERFSLDADATLLVTEVACSQPGCPPLETVVAFWTEGDRRHQFKVFKPAGEVTPADLPYAWMKDGLAVPEGFSCDCC
jgi:nitrate reductase delta subunit